MRWNCSECGHKAIVTNVRKLDKKFKQAYTLCQDIECQHRELIDISHNKTMSPPINKRPCLDLAGLVGGLSAEDKTRLASMLSG